MRPWRGFVYPCFVRAWYMFRDELVQGNLRYPCGLDQIFPRFAPRFLFRFIKVRSFSF
jgi:hypothetical protein